MLIQHIALVPENRGMDLGEIAQVAAALQTQIIRDFGPLWGVRSTVQAYPRLEDLPLDCWPIFLHACPLGSAAGLHTDESGQPYAHIELSPTWSLDASRACLDMLTNPSGRRTTLGAQLDQEQGAVPVLLEVCGPCEDAQYAYTIGDVLVSDFCTPAFFEGALASNSHGRYSYQWSVEAPLHPLPGGHLTWLHPITNQWWLRRWLGDEWSDDCIGPLGNTPKSTYDLVRTHVHADRVAMPSRAVWEARLRALRQRRQAASVTRAQRLREAFARQVALPLDRPKSRSERDHELVEETTDCVYGQRFEQADKPTQEATGFAYDRELEQAVEMLSDEEFEPPTESHAAQADVPPAPPPANRLEPRDDRERKLPDAERSEFATGPYPDEPSPIAVEHERESQPSIAPVSVPRQRENASAPSRPLWWAMFTLAAGAVLAGAWRIQQNQDSMAGVVPPRRAVAPVVTLPAHTSLDASAALSETLPTAPDSLELPESVQAGPPAPPVISPAHRPPAVPRRMRPRTRPVLPAEIEPVGAEPAAADRTNQEQATAPAPDASVARSIEDLIESRR